MAQTDEQGEQPKARRELARKDRRESFGSRDLTRYSPESALAVCERIAGGETLTSICSEKGMPTRNTFYRWTMLYDSLKKAYDAARELSAQTFEEEALDMARVLKGKNDFNSNKIRSFDIAMQQLRWSASRRDPSKYANQNSPTITVPVQINTSLDLGDAEVTGQGVYRLQAQVADPEQPDNEDVLTPPEEEGERNILPKGQKRGQVKREAKRKKKEEG